MINTILYKRLIHLFSKSGKKKMKKEIILIDFFGQ